MNTNKQPKGLPAIEVSLFCQQAAMILKSGIPLYDGMEVLYQNYRETEYGELFQKIFEGVRDGGTLYDGVNGAGIFPDYMVHMVRVGEMTGKLDDVLEALGEYYEKEDRLHTSIKNAIAYPLVLTAMMAVVIGILVIKVLPVFSEVFKSLGTDLSGTTNLILSGGVTLGRIVLCLTAVFLLASIFLALFWRLGGKKKVLTFCSHFIPSIRHLLEKQSAGRFASVISMVLFSGYSLENALELIPGLLSDEQTAKKAGKCRELLEETGDFANAVEQLELFDPLYRKMLRVGAEAGQTDHVMKRIADIYDAEVEDGIQNLVSWIEPALVAVLTIMIGGILLSVMLPLVSIMTSIG